MGVTLDRNLSIAGYRPTQIKAALACIERTGNPGRVLRLESSFSDPRDGAIALEECIDRGLLTDFPDCGITAAGIAFASGKAAKRASRAKAFQVLDGFLSAVAANNANPQRLQTVERVWLFGSLMRAADDVGDIDLAVETSQGPHFSGISIDEWRKRVETAMEESDDIPPMQTYEAPHWLLNRSLFGRRRHPLLSGAKLDAEALKSLGVPCKLVYEQARGKVDDPPLPMHPGSKGRTEAANDPLKMPDLSPRPLAPSDADWLTGYNGRGFLEGFASIMDGEYRPILQQTMVFGGCTKPGWMPWKDAPAAKASLDGRNSSAVFSAWDGRRYAAIVRREMVILPDRWLLRAWLENFASSGGTSEGDAVPIENMARVLASIISLDIERMRRRADEAGTHPLIAVETMPSDGIAGTIVEQADEILYSCSLRTTPPGGTYDPIDIGWNAR